MSEPDRFDAQARELVARWYGPPLSRESVPWIAAALRAAESSALERAARWFMRCGLSKDLAEAVAFDLRALIPPAVAPAAERDPVEIQEINAWVDSALRGGLVVSTTLPAITYVNAEQWAAAGQPPLDDKKLREPGCQCHQEEGDSPCPVHGDDAPAAETGKDSVTPELTDVIDYGTLSTEVDNGDNNGAQASEGSAGGVREAGRLDETAGARSCGGGSEDSGARVAVPVRSVPGRANDAVRRDRERDAPVIGLPSKANAPNDLLGVVAAYPEQAAQFIEAQEALLRECEKAFLVLKKDAAFMSPALHVLLVKLAARAAPPEGEGNR